MLIKKANCSPKNWNNNSKSISRSIIITLVLFIAAQSVFLIIKINYHQEEIEESNLIIDRQNSVITEQSAKLDKLGESLKVLKKENIEISMKADDFTNEISNLKSHLLMEKQRAERYRGQYLNLRKNYRNQVNSELARERGELVKNQQVLERELSEVRTKEGVVNSKIADIGEWERKKNEFDKLYAASAMKAQNEQRVSNLMERFNRLRVDLDVLNECDKGYLYRYNEAKSVLNHIRTFIQKYKMNQDYYFFVISNDSAISAQNRKLCLRN